jgi:hypothetical protein
MTERLAPQSNHLESLEGLQEFEFGDNERRLTAESRYRYSLLEAADGTQYFSKQLAGAEQSSDDKWAKYLEREAIWAEFAVAVGANNPDLNITGLAPLYQENYEAGGVKRLVYPFVDAPFLAEPGVSKLFRDPWVMSRYIKILRAFDSEAEDWQPAVSMAERDEHTPFNSVDKRWDEWLEKGQLLEQGLVTTSMVTEARRIVQEHQPYVTPRFQHGDFVPWHLFAEHSGRWISFDGEHASLEKPRYYDLAYSYSRLSTRSRDTDSAARMLGGFIVLGEQEGDFTRDEFYKAFLPVLMSRSMGMFLDAANDRKKGDDYVAEANELFARCQSRDLQALLQP